MNPRTSGKKNREQKAAGLVIQGSILAMAGVMVRIIGMFYRMPLNDIIGKQGNGYYTSVFSMYNTPFTLSSYSMLVIVLKMISVRLARGEHRNCSHVLKVVPIYAAVMGGIAAVVLWFGADLFAELIKAPFSRYVLKALAPTIWTMAYLGVLRGYFQGAGIVVPMVVSQISEQIVNAVISMVAAGVLFGMGTPINAAQGARDYSYILDAAGGAIGTRAGIFTASLFLICLIASKGWERRRLVREDMSGRVESYRRIFYILAITVLPIVISSDIYNCSNVVGNYLSGQGMDRLDYLEDSIAIYWGVLGQYQLLSNIPVAVSSTLSSFLIPSLTRVVANRNRREKLERIATPIHFSLPIAIPVAAGIAVLAKLVCGLLFINRDNTMLIRLPTTGSLVVVFCSLSTIINAIFQGLNYMDVPIHHVVIALVVRIAASGVFPTTSKTEIYSVMFASVTFILVVCLLNGYVIIRSVEYRQKYKRTLILPTICAGFMGVAAYGVYRGIYVPLPHRLIRGRIDVIIVVFPSVAMAILIYTVLFVRLRAMEEEELEGMPRERRLVRPLDRFRLLG